MKYSEKTLRKKAREAGYTIHHGFQHQHNGAIVAWRGTGYNIVDEVTGQCDPWCFNQMHDHDCSLEDVENFLRKVYEDAGLKF